MKKAFTIIEVILVMTVMAILAGIAKVSFPDNRLQTDTAFIIQQIKNRQAFALHYDHHSFSDPNWQTNYHDNTCITLDKESLQKNQDSVKNYTLSTQTNVQIDTDYQKICFDTLGRPYKDNYSLNNLLKIPININIEYKNRSKQISVLPYSGYIIQ